MCYREVHCTRHVCGHESPQTETRVCRILGLSILSRYSPKISFVNRSTAVLPDAATVPFTHAIAAGVSLLADNGKNCPITRCDPSDLRIISPGSGQHRWSSAKWQIPFAPIARWDRDIELFGLTVSRRQRDVDSSINFIQFYYNKPKFD